MNIVFIYICLLRYHFICHLYFRITIQLQNNFDYFKQMKPSRMNQWTLKIRTAVMEYGIKRITTTLPVFPYKTVLRSQTLRERRFSEWLLLPKSLSVEWAATSEIVPTDVNLTKMFSDVADPIPIIEDILQGAHKTCNEEFTNISDKLSATMDLPSEVLGSCYTMIEEDTVMIGSQ